MTPEERRRAGQAVRDRMVELGMNQSDLEQAAGITSKTLGSLLDGSRRTGTKTLGKVERALGWEESPGEIERRGRSAPSGVTVESAPDSRLLAELLRRAALREASTPAVESQEDASTIDLSNHREAAQRRRPNGPTGGKSTKPKGQ